MIGVINCRNIDSCSHNTMNEQLVDATTVGTERYVKFGPSNICFFLGVEVQYSAL